MNEDLKELDIVQSDEDQKRKSITDEPTSEDADRVSDLNFTT